MKEPAYKRGPYKKHIKEEDEMRTKRLNSVPNGSLIKELEDRGYFASKIPPQHVGRVFQGEVKRSGEKYRIGVVSDTHMGSMYQQVTHLYTAYQEFKDSGVDVVLHAGDVCDGEKVYRGQEYELFLHGADAQRDYVVKNYPHEKGIKTYIISGNHDASFWSVSGYNIVESICDARDDMVFLGDNSAAYMVEHIKIGLIHPDGGVPYARSYRLQKIIEQLSPENKPNILLAGHLHIEAILPMYRNVLGMQLPAFQAQTPYLARKGLYPELGAWIIEFGVNDKGMTDIFYKHIPFYVPIKNDF